MKSISDITFKDASSANIKRENANIDGNTAMVQCYSTEVLFLKNFVKVSY